MSIRIVTCLTLFCLTTNAGRFEVRAADAATDPADPFALDGDQILLDEAHLGIVNGHATISIPHRNVAAIAGLWAPPFASSDFNLAIKLAGVPVKTEHYTWHPTQVLRHGQVQGLEVETVTALIPGWRGGLIEVTVKNPGTETQTIPLTLTVGGSLDRVTRWEFSTVVSKTPTVPKLEADTVLLTQGEQAVVIRPSGNVEWDKSQSTATTSISIPATGSATWSVGFAIGPTSNARSACETIMKDPGASLAVARATYQERVRDLYEKLPRLESSNAALTRFYDRSLVHFIMNRWDVPEFALRPNYTTGSVNGGCICNYLWDFGEPWEIFPLYDAAASRTHIKQFVAIDMASHFSFDPVEAKAWGPWYPVNQEKIVGLIFYYVKNTGDLEFLKTEVNGQTILEHALANARFGDDPTKPVRMIDYGPSNSHLELRRGFPYNHVMPDLNGRRYETYLLAAQLADWGGQPAPDLRRRAEELKAAFKRELWNPHTRWFDFVDANGRHDTRWTIQMFKLFGSQILDAEQEQGLLDHLHSEREFLSEFGLHSLSKTDIAYDQVDIDNGGGGSYTGFPPQIAERLYKAGQAAAAENILKRILWWGDRVPYWGDSFVANQMDYRKDTPLQNTIGGTSGAQCIVFGMFGVRAEIDGTVRIDPHPPAVAPKISLRGLKLRGHVLDINVDGGQFEVRQDERRLTSTVGRAVLVRGDELLLAEELPHK